MSLPAWRRNQYVMVATVFVVFTGFAFVLPFLPLYVKELGVADDERAALWAGVLIGVAPLLAGLLAPFWGRLADRHGHKPMALRALGAYVVLLALSAGVTSVWQLFVLRAGIGLFGGIGPLGLAMATSLAPREETGRAVGLVQSAQILSAAIGPFVGGFLADVIGIRATFLVTALVCAAALALVVLWYREAPRRGPEQPAALSVPFAEVLRIRQVPALLAILFFVNFIGRSFTPILPLHLMGLGVPGGRVAFLTGILISVYSIAAALSAALLGRESRRRSPRRLLWATLIAGAATVLPMAAVSSYAQFVGLAVALGLASGGSLTLCYTLGGLMVPAERRATAFGFFSGAALFGGSVAPVVAGLLAHWRLHAIYYLDGLLYLGLAAALPAAARHAEEAASRGASPGGDA
jgi:DHA1 family multidrug resistance protein-like MFS transporter